MVGWGNETRGNDLERTCVVAGVIPLLRVQWTDRQGSIFATPQIRLQCRVVRSDCLAFPILQSPLLFCAIDLAQVIDAGVGLSRSARMHHVWYGDCRQQT